MSPVTPPPTATKQALRSSRARAAARQISSTVKKVLLPSPAGKTNLSAASKQLFSQLPYSSSTRESVTGNSLP